MKQLRYLIEYSFSHEKDYNVENFMFINTNKKEKKYLELVPYSVGKINLPYGEFIEKIKILCLDPTGVVINKVNYNKIVITENSIKLYK